MNLKQHYATETYISKGGYYVIKQDREQHHSEESLILLTSSQLQELLLDIQHALSMSTEWDVVSQDEEQE